METMNISLPEQLKRIVDARLASGHYSTASEYVRELIRKDVEKEQAADLEALLLAGLRSESTPFTATTLADIRQQVYAAQQRATKTET